MKVSRFEIESDDLEVSISRDTRKNHNDGFLIEDSDGCIRVNMEILKELLEAAKLLEQQ